MKILSLFLALSFLANPQGFPANGKASAAAPPSSTVLAGSNNTFFVTWRDLKEDAFQIGVPQGWQVSGGMVRTNTVEAHAVIKVQSPDGKILIFYDDPEQHPRQVPDQLTQLGGLREGQTIRGAWGGPVVLARFVTGTQFAQQYIQSRLCRQPMITALMELKTATDQMNAAIAPYAAQQRTESKASIGEASFQCGSSSGYVLANTLYARPAVGSGAMMWFVYQLGGFQVSDPQQTGLAFYVLNTMFETFKSNPQWEARVAKEVQDLTGAVTKMQNAMAQTIAQYGQQQAVAASAGGFNHPNSGQLPTDLRKKWATESASRQKYSDATLGQTWVHSSTGANVRVDNSVTNWWRDPSGSVIPGPESGGPPAGSGGRYEKLQPGWQP